jgi:hypothetical protein
MGAALAVMIRPSPGLMCTHGGIAVEFLHLSCTTTDDGEAWIVRPLFVEAENRLVVFRPGDRLTPLHSQHR